MPLISVIAIVMIVAAVVAAVVAGSKEQIIQSGLLIFAVVILHNGLGYVFGFFIAKLFKLDYADQKAISIRSRYAELGTRSSTRSSTLQSTCGCT